MGQDAFLNKIAHVKRLLLDTNAIIYFLQGISPYDTILNPLFRLFEEGRLQAVISVITEAELLVGPLKKNNKEALARVRLLLNEFPGLEVIPVSRQIGQMAASIRVETNLPLPDALIIATAKSVGCDAIVGNDQSWSRIDMPEVLLLDDYVNVL
ncbi:MAG TPA: type II toxin-antitoxin system VapC family toxin [Syntrophomonadaceae bacterium]|nr:type II toxin-antitoxin system VapC family toxin [Syntrophomonadaceae bacterium]